ncbi:unnamed protein product [Dracunculus medinensis]|uniref:Uncharacterized protein n=1 Tax=Dracunculus medinensis TaxID=318479 RepID=A0A0N4UMW4_DRAME|nr:unnamed protein product [Dracunculus medinensis]
MRCDCRDWYGRCKLKGEMWIDDEIWNYMCQRGYGEDANFIGCLTHEKTTEKRLILMNTNVTIDGFWFSCESDEKRIKYEEEPRCMINETKFHVGDEFRDGFFNWICLDTGRWVTGCYYQNESKHWIKLKIGEIAYNGLVMHVCDRYDDYPGRIQYYAEVRKDIAQKNPTNKGINANLPEPIDNRLKKPPIRWLHENAADFIFNDNPFRLKIRYLPSSRRSWTTVLPSQHRT